MKKSFFRLFFLLTLFRILSAGPQEFSSPSDKTRIEFNHSDSLDFKILFNNKLIIRSLQIAIDIEKKTFDQGDFNSLEVKSIDRKVISHIPTKNKEIRDNFQQFKVPLSKKVSLCFRLYDNGFAYRYESDYTDSIRIFKEKMEVAFPENDTVYFPEEESVYTHQEREYKKYLINDIKSDQFASIPLLLARRDSVKILISESNLRDYPGFYLKGADHENRLRGKFPYYPDSVKQTSDRDVKVVNTRPYLAKTSGKRVFPWRVYAFSSNDKEIINNELIYLLAAPSEIETQWIHPGKVAWDWWNANNLYHVDFRSGVNTKTYKYYIDFASENGIEYIIMDEGWYDLKDLRKVSPEIDMEELSRYSRKKNVGIILWTTWKALWDHLEESLDQFQAWGIKGIKVDFMQRDDQWMTRYYWKIAEEAARRQLLVDFHGSYKPAGLRRTYPNALTREGVRGLEQSKWSDWANPEMAVTLPFIRMFAGPMDYTPGAMDNATKDNFRPMWSRPMSQGTRCHQIAMYVVFESPLQMLADSPSNYLKEKECLDFISKIPVTWDKTEVLEAELGNHVVLARKKDEKWYMGGMTDWNERDFNLALDFLDSDSEYEMILMKDGINADKRAVDYVREKKPVKKGDNLSIHLAPGGGFCAILEIK